MESQRARQHLINEFTSTEASLIDFGVPNFVLHIHCLAREIVALLLVRVYPVFLQLQINCLQHWERTLEYPLVLLRTVRD